MSPNNPTFDQISNLRDTLTAGYNQLEYKVTNLERSYFENQRNVRIGSGKIDRVLFDSKGRALYSYYVVGYDAIPPNRAIPALGSHNSSCIYTVHTEVIILSIGYEHFILGKKDSITGKTEEDPENIPDNYRDYKPSNVGEGDKIDFSVWGFLKYAFFSGDLFYNGHTVLQNCKTRWHAQTGFFENYFENGYIFSSQFGWSKWENELKHASPADIKKTNNYKSALIEHCGRSWTDQFETDNMKGKMFSERRHWNLRMGGIFKFFERDKIKDTAALQDSFKPVVDLRFFNDDGEQRKETPTEQIVRISIDKATGQIYINGEDKIDIIINKNINVVSESGDINISTTGVDAENNPTTIPANINITASGGSEANINVIASDRVNITSIESDTNITAGSDTNITAGGKAVITAENDVEVTSTSGEIKLKSNTHLTGTLVTTSTISAGGAITAGGDVSSSSKSLNNHTHGPGTYTTNVGTGGGGGVVTGTSGKP